MGKIIRAILFDMDGLMIDTERLYWTVGRELAAEFGKRVEDGTLRRMMGRDRLTSSQIYAEDTGVPLSAEEIMHRRERMMLEKFAGGIEPMPGLVELLKRFDGRLKLGVATSSPRLLADAALGGLGLKGYFAALTTGDEIARGKPEPDIYLTAAGRLGTPAGECVVLEDAPAGATAGKRAGGYVIAVPSELTAGEDFSAMADERVKDLFEAAGRIEGLMG